MGLPTIYEVEPSYDSKTAREYDVEANKELKKQEKENEIIQETQEELKQTQEELENLNFLRNSSNTIKEAIYNNPKLTESSYQFTDQETYTNTNFSDKTDTYINMNTSFRYIKYNVSGAGNLYNQLSEGNNFRTDSPKKVFESIKNRFVTLGFNKIVNEQGKLETFEIKNDTDMLYVIGFFQTFLKDKLQDSSNIDFRIGPKTLAALLDDNNKLIYTETKQVEKDETPETAQKEAETTSEETEGNKENNIEEQTEKQPDENTTTTEPEKEKDETPETNDETHQETSANKIPENEEEVKVLNDDFKEGLQQNLNIQNKITNIDKLINEYPDISILIQSMKKIGIDYETAKKEKNETDINNVIRILNEIEYRNIAKMQNIINIAIEIKLSAEKTIRFIVFYKAIINKEILNPDLTSINTLRASYGYNKNKDLIAQAEYEDRLLELYTTQTDKEKKRIIVKEYTRTLLEKDFPEDNDIRTENKGKIYKKNNIDMGMFYNKETNEFFINYVSLEKLPRKDDFETVIFSKEDFLSQEKIVEEEKEKTLSDYEEFETMQKKLDNEIASVKSTLITFSAINKYDYKKFTFPEETKTNSTSKKIIYDGKVIAEIGIGIKDNDIMYFGTYKLYGKENTQRGKEIITQEKILELITRKMEEMYPNIAEWKKKENYKNNLT